MYLHKIGSILPQRFSKLNFYVITLKPVKVESRQSGLKAIYFHFVSRLTLVKVHLTRFWGDFHKQMPSVCVKLVPRILT